MQLDPDFEFMWDDGVAPEPALDLYPNIDAMEALKALGLAFLGLGAFFGFIATLNPASWKPFVR
jgi:predicted amino acid dehydrogenase